jgi:hypothetical protein
MEIRVNPLSPQSVKDARKEIIKYKKGLPKKCITFAQRLAEEGLKAATITFTSAVYDIGVYGNTLQHANISVTMSQDIDKNGHFTISAMGQEVAFVEFGAGVYFNSLGGGSGEPRPEGIVGIGEYGKGKGKQDAWAFVRSDGELCITRGTPAQHGMWNAAQIMRQQIEKIAKEVFAS